MSEKTIYEAEEIRTRRGLATYFRRLARRLNRGEPVPANEEQTVTVEVPANPELEVEIEQEDGTTSLEIEVEWPVDEGAVETEVTASKATFELFEDNAEEWRWRLVHDNGNIIADGSEGYASKQKARQGIESVKTNAPGAAVVDTANDEEPDSDGTSKATFELFEDRAGKWRWRLRHDNGNIISDCGQGYASKQKAKQGLRSVTSNARGAPVE